jgi:hypothetical protein
VPVAAVAPTVKVRTELPEAPIDVGEKAAVTPEGRPETDNVIVAPYPPKGVLVTVEAPLLPCTIETAVPESEKPEVGNAPVSAAKRPEFGLPQPVTRS